MEEITAQQVARLFLAEIAQQNTESETRQLFASAGSLRVAGVSLVLQNVLDHIVDYEYRGGQSFLKACEAVRSRIANVPDSIQPEIVGLVGLVCLNVKLLERRFESPDLQEQQRADEYCRDLFQHTPIWSAIQAIYNPDSDEGRARGDRRLSERDGRPSIFRACGTTKPAPPRLS